MAHNEKQADDGTLQMRVEKSLSDAFALSNYVTIAPGQVDPSEHYLLVNNEFVFTARNDNSMHKGVLGTSAMHRRWAQLSLNEEVSVVPYNPFQESNSVYLSSLRVEVGFLRKSAQMDVDDFDTEKMEEGFSSSFHNQIFSIGQILVFDFRGVKLLCKIADLQVVDLETLKKAARGEIEPEAMNGSPASRGVLMRQTAIQFGKSSESTIRLKGAKKSTTAKALIKADFKFEDLGIGGLDKEFSDIFRRAFASRIFPPSIVEKLGVQHVKGLLLYGPPGTGKTLIARQIGKMLNAQEPKVVSGPEVLSKFVGQSEENVRKLFADAEAEYKSKGEESSLHIIIFDELDAICKQRGSRGDSSGVGDSVVNQLLAKMDGVDQLNNILIIGKDIQERQICPKLVGFLANEDPAAKKYAEWTAKTCAETGVAFELRKVDKQDLEEKITEANEDKDVNGIMVYYPVFGGKQDAYLQNCVSELKDVEGLCHKFVHNVYHNVRYMDEEETMKCIIPCTPLAVVKILEYIGVYNSVLPYGNRLYGRTITVINRSEIVGRPLAAMLSNDGAKVYSVDVNGIQLFTRGSGIKLKAHKVEDIDEKLEDVVPKSDVVITGVPTPKYKLPTSLLKDGVVAINFSSCANFEDDVKSRASIFVPSVGKVTVAMLERNLLRLHDYQHNLREKESS